jgi:hypothetical protein
MLWLSRVKEWLTKRTIDEKEVIVANNKTSISRSAFHGQNGQCSQPPPSRTKSDRQR